MLDGSGWNVCYASDDAFAMQVGVSLISLFENHADIGSLRVYLLADRIGEDSLRALESIASDYRRELVVVDVRDELRRIRSRSELAYGEIPGYTTFARIFLPALLPQEVERVLYLDGDTLVTASLRALERLDMRGKLVGAVLDLREASYPRRIGLPPDAAYHNAGVLWIDLHGWRKHRVMESLLRCLEQTRLPLAFRDQDLLNIVLGGDFLTLPLRYNLLGLVPYFTPRQIYFLLGKDGERYYSEQEILGACEDPAILHFTANRFQGRPWQSNCTDPRRDLWRKVHGRSPWRDRGIAPKPLSGLEVVSRALARRLPGPVFTWPALALLRIRRML